jgi:DNA transformation protein
VTVSSGFRSFVLEQLGRVVRDVRSRSMFGGVGIYSGDLFFALIDDDTLYFKVDNSTRSEFESRGMEPFRPSGPEGEVMQYYCVPEEILEDTEALDEWVQRATAVARRARKRPRRR